MSDPVLDALERVVVAVRTSSAADRYLDTAGVADILGFSVAHTRDVIVHRPDFPKPSPRFKQSRWLRSDVLRWAAMRET